ncbi:FAD-dependent oxidoreductase [Allostella vacuolata]|nr:FAD-dependent oxidoreductase [Stella vacuolata]
MALVPLSTLDGRRFDVAVIGAGVNGASAAQHLQAAGYSTLLVDKGDFGAGSSSRSSRILGNGLRYLAPGRSMWDFVRHPQRFRNAARMAQYALAARTQMVEETGERVRAINFCYPIYSDSQYAPWQIRAAFALLGVLNRGGTSLGYRMLGRDEALALPLVRWVRTPEKLRTVALHHQYQFDWPERIVLDTAFDAERMGAAVRNYTAVAGLERLQPKGWRLRLADAVDRGQGIGSATVEAAMVINAAGIWIDRVNGLAKPDARRRITGTKGVHIAIRLPPECRDYCVVSLNRDNEQIYCVPWRDGLHYIGPTESLYDGDPDDIRPTEPEIEWLLEEFAHLVPGAGIKRRDVLYAWAGVRPLTHDPAMPKGNRSRRIHDQADDGMDGVLSITAGPLMSHRVAGRDLAGAVAARMPPSAAPQPLSYAARSLPDEPGSPALLNHRPGVTIAQLRHAAMTEQPNDLVDLLFRRVGLGWGETMARDGAGPAARAVADILGWDEDRIAREVAGYRDYLERMHLLDTGSG